MWVSAIKSSLGTVRSVNEDAYLVNDQIKVWAVADGMGGLTCGDVASKEVVNNLGKIQRSSNLNDFVLSIEENLINSNLSICNYSNTIGQYKKVGTTVACLLLFGKIGVCLWVGDSRVYRLRNNKLEQLTEDHSYVGELVKAGVISETDAANDPRTNVLTRAIGVEEELVVDICAFEINQNDMFLLCSDGLYNTVDKNNIQNILTNYGVQDSVEILMHNALTDGAPDNITAIVIKNYNN